jgi:hypothetical protein
MGKKERCMAKIEKYKNEKKCRDKDSNLVP